MLKEVIFSGKTIENAVENACAKLGIDSDELAYQIVTMPKKGFLGIGGQDAEISVEVECPDEPKKVEKAVKEEKKTEKKESKKVEKTEKKEEKAEEKKEEPKKETSQHLHLFHVNMLTFHIGLAHIDKTRHVHQGTDGGGCHSMLSCSGFGDDAAFSHPFG